MDDKLSIFDRLAATEAQQAATPTPCVSRALPRKHQLKEFDMPIRPLHPSERTKRVISVLGALFNHIDGYAQSQYGDYPNDKMTGYDVEKIKTELEKYVARIGKNARGPEDAIRDALKLMHYAAELYLALGGQMPGALSKYIPIIQLLAGTTELQDYAAQAERA